MLIEQIDNNKIKVTVGKREQQEYGVTYESMNYSDANTRRLCEDIMEKAHDEVGFNLGDAKLLVEAKMARNGEVTLFLSKMPTAAVPEETAELFGQMLRFETSNDLLDGINLFSPQRDNLCTSSLYFFKSHYYIYFEILCTHSEAKKLLRNLLEFSSRTKLTHEFLDEHGRVIISNTAIDEMCEKLKNVNKNKKQTDV